MLLADNEKVIIMYGSYAAAELLFMFFFLIYIKV